MAQMSNIYIAMARQSFVNPPFALPVRITRDIFDLVFAQHAFRFFGL